MHIFKNWILSFGIKKLAIISTVAVVGVTGTTVAITSVKKSENAVVEEEKIVINTQSGEDKETEVEKVEEVTEEVANQEVVTETTPQEPETETVKQQTTTNATTTNNSSSGNTTTNNNSGTTNNNTTAETPKLETVVLNVGTRYVGFAGYFTKQQSVVNVDWSKYGITNTSGYTTVFPTEYRDINTNELIYFVCGDVPDNDYEPYSHDNLSAVLGQIKVNVVDGTGTMPTPIDLSSCGTITLFQTVSYMGYTGHFSKENKSSNGTRGYSVYFTEYYDGETGENIMFVSEDSNFNDSTFKVSVKRAGLGTVPVRVK